MSVLERYTTNLSKAQGMVPETFELLEIWEPGMSAAALKAQVRLQGALGKDTQVRVDDLVGRGFSQRFLIDHGKPAKWLKQLLQDRTPKGVMRQLILIYTARANLILRDFICDVFWVKCSSGAGEVTKQDALDFIGGAVNRGSLDRAWSETMVERVARYLLGTLVDFELIEGNQYGQRQIRPLFILPETVIYLAYELHFSNLDDDSVIRHRDWKLFGLSQAAVISAFEKAAMQEHLFLQHSGAITRIEWKYANMEEVINALTH